MCHKDDGFFNTALHEISIKDSPSFQDIQGLVDDYIQNVASILNNNEYVVQPAIEYTLRQGLAIIEYYGDHLKELDYYRRKYTKIAPENLEMSKLKRCYVGKCKCGQLLVESKDRCCPKCNQFILWPKRT